VIKGVNPLKKESSINVKYTSQQSYIKLILVTLFFASNFIIARVNSTSLSPITSSALRFLIASLLLLLIVFQKYRKLPKITFYQLKIIILLGIVGIAGDSICFFSGLKYTTASKASIIVALNPICLATFSSLFFNEKLNFLKFTGIFISLIGTIVVISNGSVLSVFHGNISIGELYILGAVICWVFFTLLGKSVSEKLDSIIILCYSSIVGSITLTTIGIQQHSFTDLNNMTLWIMLGTLSIGTLGTAISYKFYYEAVYSIGASRSGIFLNLVPVFATIGGILILNENLSLSFFMGAIMVLTGVYITNYQRTKVI
jgi:drug/metabolite transporter (DMT)-like permease